MAANQNALGKTEVHHKILGGLKVENHVKFTKECVIRTKKHIFIKKKKKFMNGLIVGLPSWAWVKKTVYRVETHWLTDKEKVSGSAFHKKGHVYSLLGHESNHDNWFPWKNCYWKRCFYYPLFRKNSPYLLNNLHVYQYYKESKIFVCSFLYPGINSARIRVYSPFSLLFTPGYG